MWQGKAGGGLSLFDANTSGTPPAADGDVFSAVGWDEKPVRPSKAVEPDQSYAQGDTGGTNEATTPSIQSATALDDRAPADSSLTRNLDTAAFAQNGDAKAAAAADQSPGEPTLQGAADHAADAGDGDGLDVFLSGARLQEARDKAVAHARQLERQDKRKRELERARKAKEESAAREKRC